MDGARRVAISGLGVLAPAGATPTDVFENVAAGRSAVRRLDAPWASRLRSPIGARVDGFDAPSCYAPSRLRLLDRVAQLGCRAAALALADARFEPDRIAPQRCGVFVGTGMGGATSTDEGYETLYGERSDRVKPYGVLTAMSNSTAAWIGIDHGFAGANLTYSTACSSGAVAIGEAARRVASGELDLALAGGAEAPLSFGVMRAWEALRTVAEVDPREPSASCRPFARSRSGLVLAEGAAFVVLEPLQQALRRGAPPRAELLGYGLVTDREHITRPSVAGQAAAMRAALLDSGLEPEAIGYLNAHGTGTAQNDAVETAAIHRVFGAHATRLPVSSTKAVHGHLLGAAGALELAIAVLALQHDAAPPTMHLDVPDPDCDLDYVTGGVRAGLGLRAVMSNSFAFGGTNAVLIALAVDATRPS